jgi:hypothetical protein
MSMEPKTRKNEHETREGYVRAAINELRPDFERRGLQIPTNIRTAVAFGPGGRKTKRKGDCLPPEASADGHFEIIIGNDHGTAQDMLPEVVIQVLHSVLGPERNRAFRDAMASLGFDVSNGVKKAIPGPILLERLNSIASTLGAIPHAKVDWSKATTPRGKPRKQTTRMLKAECVLIRNNTRKCGYTLRVSSVWAIDPGPPHCPLHGSMFIHWPDGEEPSTTINGVCEEVPPLLGIAEA